MPLYFLFASSQVKVRVHGDCVFSSAFKKLPFSGNIDKKLAVQKIKLNVKSRLCNKTVTVLLKLNLWNINLKPRSIFPNNGEYYF